uniref:Uncharacterized protein n=1 Tax=Rhizophora mucronata TaxID=61149 RepID=A0A2P2PRJ6_RHIMU
MLLRNDSLIILNFVPYTKITARGLARPFLNPFSLRMKGSPREGNQTLVREVDVVSRELEGKRRYEIMCCTCLPIDNIIVTLLQLG